MFYPKPVSIKKILLFISFAFLFILFRAGAQQDPRIEILLGEADVLIGEKQLDAALEKVGEALRIDVLNTEAVIRQINIYYLLNDDKEAMRLADLAIEADPSEPGFYYLRGIINNMREKYAKAIDDFDESARNAPQDISYKIYLGRGISYMNLLEYDDAMADLTKSISLNDTNASAYHTRAMLNYELKEYQAAINDFIKALDYSEGTSVLYYNLGMSYFRLEQQTEACPYFQKSCSMGNNNACKMILMECAREIPDIR